MILTVYYLLIPMDLAVQVLHDFCKGISIHWPFAATVKIHKFISGQLDHINRSIASASDQTIEKWQLLTEIKEHVGIAFLPIHQ